MADHGRVVYHVYKGSHTLPHCHNIPCRHGFPRLPQLLIVLYIFATGSFENFIGALQLCFTHLPQNIKHRKKFTFHYIAVKANIQYYPSHTYLVDIFQGSNLVEMGCEEVKRFKVMFWKIMKKFLNLQHSLLWVFFTVSIDEVIIEICITSLSMNKLNAFIYLK